ncbi:MAG: hypothetical protein PVF89_07880, partial [Lysobacterales bacterium]
VDRRKAVRFVVEAVKPILHILTDARSKEAIELIQRFARGAAVSAAEARGVAIAAGVAAWVDATARIDATPRADWSDAADWSAATAAANAAWEVVNSTNAVRQFAGLAARDAAFWAARAAAYTARAAATDATDATAAAVDRDAMTAALANQREIAIGLISDAFAAELPTEEIKAEFEYYLSQVKYD